MTDLWAAAGGQKVADRTAEQRALDPNADPFGTPDATGGQSGPRGPQWPDVLDRLVVLKPVEKLTGQPVPNQPDQTQDFYACDLTVLDGGPLTVATPAREVNGKSLPAETNTFEVPFTFTRWYAYGRAVTVKLDNLKLPLFLGVVKRCPTGPGYRAGRTWEDSTREWDEYVRRMQADPARAGSKPQFSWGLIDPTPEQRAAALAWYRAQQ